MKKQINPTNQYVSLNFTSLKEVSCNLCISKHQLCRLKILLLVLQCAVLNGATAEHLRCMMNPYCISFNFSFFEILHPNILTSVYRPVWHNLTELMKLIYWFLYPLQMSKTLNDKLHYQKFPVIPHCPHCDQGDNIQDKICDNFSHPRNASLQDEEHKL